MFGVAVINAGRAAQWACQHFSTQSEVMKLASCFTRDGEDDSTALCAPRTTLSSILPHGAEVASCAGQAQPEHSAMMAASCSRPPPLHFFHLLLECFQNISHEYFLFDVQLCSGFTDGPFCCASFAPDIGALK